MLFTILISCSFLILVLTYYWFKNLNNDYWKKQNITYVEKNNPFGIFWDYLLDNKPLGVIYKDILEKYPNESHVGIFQGRRPALIIKDPVNIQAVMAGDFMSFYNRGIFVNPNDKLNDSVIFMEDYPRWKLMRQKVTPVFTSAKLRNMFYIMEHSAKNFVEYVSMKKDAKVKPFDIVYNYSTSSISASVFSIDPQLKNSIDSPFVHMASNAFTVTLLRKIQLTLLDFWPEAGTFFNIKLLHSYEKFFIDVVKNVLRSRENENVKRHDFIDLCVELQNNGTMKDPTTNYEIEPTDEVLAAQAFFFFTAGADTTASTIHFTLFELAKNPDILAKLHKEIDEIFSRHADTIPYDEVDKLQYMNMVLNESMRKYPVVANILRHCTKDTILPNEGIKMKKNTLAIIPVYAIHRDPRYYPNPDKFDPERFSPENVGKIVKYSFLPFGEGNRICIGARYARLQIKTGLTYLLRRFTLRTTATDDDVKFEPSNFALRDPEIKYEFIARK